MALKILLSALLLLCSGPWSATEAMLGRSDARLYVTTERGLDETEGPRYVEEWSVEVPGGAEVARQLADKYGLTNRGKIGNLRGHYHFSGTRSKGPVSIEKSHLTSVLAAEENVGSVEQQLVTRRYKRGYTEPNTCVWQRQWALRNTGQTNGPAGLDLNVESAWIQGITGRGVVVGIVDDGIDWKHPALEPNYDSGASYDFIHSDDDPTPDPPNSMSDNGHGTACAGEVGMVKESACGVGVAYNSRIAGLKFNVEMSLDVQEASALGYQSNYIQIYSNSWGPGDTGDVVEGPGTLVQQTFQAGVSQGRNGSGSIYVWAAGNGGLYNDSCAADGYVSSIYTIGVGSADQQGRQADYDENCAAKMATTFSYNSDTFPPPHKSWAPYNQIRTAALNNRCTEGFTGTSASAPLVAGTIALALEANSNLTWRDVQYLIAYTSNQSRLVGGDWVVNGAGLRVSPQFGFGAVDAEALISRARHWISVPAQARSKLFTGERFTGVATNRIPFTTTLTVLDTNTEIIFLEHVVANIALFLTENGGFSSLRRGDIQVQLTSPTGTSTTLLPYRSLDDNTEGYTVQWPFMSVHFWGETPVGNWTLRVDYRSSSGQVDVILGGLTLYGTAVTPEAVARVPAQCDSACAHSCAANGSQFCDVCRYYRNASTLNCVTNCGTGLTEYNHYCIDQLTTSNVLCSISIPAVIGIVVSGFLVICGVCIVSGCLIHICYNRTVKRRKRQLVACNEEETDYVPAV